MTTSRDTLAATLAASPHNHTPRFVEHYLAFLLAQASHRISAEFHSQVRAAGLTVTEWRVLASLTDTDGETIGRLAYLTLTKQPTLSKLVHRLELEGLVQRTREEDDRRQTRVQLTTRGQALASRLCSQALEHQNSVLAPLSPEQSRALLDALQVLMKTPESLAEHELLASLPNEP